MHAIAGRDEVHMETCLKDLRDEVAQCVTGSDPVAYGRETVSGVSNQSCLAMSPNKMNGLLAEPIPDLGSGGRKLSRNQRRRAAAAEPASWKRAAVLGAEPIPDNVAVMVKDGKDLPKLVGC